MGAIDIVCGIMIVAVALPAAFFIFIFLLELVGVVMIFGTLGIMAIYQKLETRRKRKFGS